MPESTFDWNSYPAQGQPVQGGQPQAALPPVSSGFGWEKFSPINGQTQSQPTVEAPSRDIYGALFENKSPFEKPDEGVLGKAWDIANLPLVDTNRAEKWFGLENSTGVGAGLAKGAIDLATGLTTPLSLALMAGTAGAGALFGEGGAALRAAGFTSEGVAEVAKGAQIAEKLRKAGGTADDVAMAIKGAGLDSTNVFKGFDALTKAGASSQDLLKQGVVRLGGAKVLENLGVGAAKADTLAHYLQLGTEAGFSAQNLYGAAVATPKVLDALNENDYETAVRLATDAVGSGLLGATGARAAMREAGSLMPEAKAALGFRSVPSETNRQLAQTWGEFDRQVVGRGRSHELWEEDVRKRYPDIKKDDLPRVMYWLESGMSEEKMIERYNALMESAGRKDRLSSPETRVLSNPKDIGDMVTAMTALHPELSDPKMSGVFKAIVAATSPGNNPLSNIRTADQVFDIYKKTGRISEVRPDGSSWESSYPEKTKSTLQNLQKVLDANGGDPEKAITWLTTEHPVSELRTVKGGSGDAGISGKADSTKLGAYALTGKSGKTAEFFLNLHGAKPTETPAEGATYTDAAREHIRQLSSAGRNPAELPPLQTEKTGGLKVTDSSAMATINRDLERRGISPPGDNQGRRSGDIVGSTEAAKKDTEYYAQAKKELGEDATVSQIATRAQQLKSDAIKKARPEFGTSDERIREIIEQRNLEKAIKDGKYSGKDFDKLVDQYNPFKLNADMRSMAQEIRSHFNDNFERASLTGVMNDKSAFGDYVTHMWQKDSDSSENQRLLAEAAAGAFSTNTSMARNRVFENAFIGQLLGKKLAVDDPIALAAHNGNVFDRAAAARNVLDVLQQSGTKASDGRPMVALAGNGHVADDDSSVFVTPKHMRSIRIADKVISAMKPEDLEKAISDGRIIKWEDRKGNPGYSWSTADYRSMEHPAFHGWNYITSDTGGSPVHALTELKVHPEAYDYLKKQLNTKSPFNEGPLKWVNKASKEAKGLLLFGSPFHMFQEALRAVMTGISPFGYEKWDVENDKLLGDLVSHQLTLKDYLNISAFQEGLAGHSKLLEKIPGLRQYQDWLQKNMFDKYIPGLKARSAKSLYARIDKMHPTWSEADKLTWAAKETNERFGGINWKREGRNVLNQDLFRTFALAPDWLESEVRFMMRAFGDQGTLARRDMAKLAGGLWLTARVLNYLATGKPHYEAPFGLAFKDKDGKTKVYSIRSMPSDTIHAISDPANFLKGRLSPLVRTGTEITTGRDDYGRKVAPHNMFFDLASNITPIPIQAPLKAATGQLTPTTTNADQLVKAAGFTVQPYRTEATKKASELASNHSESGPVDPNKMRTHQITLRLEDQLRSGEIKMDDLAKLYDQGMVSKKDAMQIKKNYEETREMDGDAANLYNKTSRLQLPEFLQVWDEMTPKEKAALQPLFLKKQKTYLQQMRGETPEARRNDETYQRLRSMGVIPF